MDRMNNGWWISLALAGGVVLGKPGLVGADEYPILGYEASPAATAQVGGSLENWKVFCEIEAVAGNNALAPAEVRFSTEGMVGVVAVGQFAYDFGDGHTRVAGDSVTHRYAQAGTYTVTAWPLFEGLQHESLCTTTVTLKAAPLASRKVECTSLTISDSEKLTATESARIQVRGYDTKGPLQGYKLRVGDEEWESDTGNFTINLKTAGDYQVEGWVKSADGQWVGGEAACLKSIRLRPAGMVEQPETGPAAAFWLGLISLFSIWSGAEIWQRKFFKR
jgi:hypothetical protein